MTACCGWCAVDGELVDQDPNVEILPPVSPESQIMRELLRIEGRLSVIEQRITRIESWAEFIARGYSRRPIGGSKRDGD